jgi:hypothetical protein
MTLKELFWSKGREYYFTDKDTHHSYLKTYSELFGKWEKEPINILEVGTYKGGSMKLFEDYFVNATIIGYDVVAPEAELKRAQVRVKDFYSIDTNELPELTIAIDDATHNILDQVKFVQMVWPKMVKGGILVVEDLWRGFEPHMDALGIPYQLFETIPPTDEDNDRLLCFFKK